MKFLHAFRGEIFVTVKNLCGRIVHLCRGIRAASIIFQESIDCQFMQVEENRWEDLETSSSAPSSVNPSPQPLPSHASDPCMRTGGFGSTGTC